ncbi:MAG TPA: HAD family hydrolase [Solirubrobacterales bacterium]|nr:HAD family hydrolase [Solirubrobacterales bacterium]
MVSAVILDVDGTLVDTNYQHAIAWDRAFARHDVFVPMWRIHRHMGMGGDQLIRELAGDEVEERCGDDIRDAESELYGELISEIRVIRGARELIEDLRERDLTVVLASSANSDEVEHYIEMLDAAEMAEWATSSDVEETKPQPDLVEAALEKAGTRDAVMVGDTVWDIEAAKRAGIPALAVLTGGYGAAELREAGAFAVYESVVELMDDLEGAVNR